MKFGCCTTINNYKILEELEYDFIELEGGLISILSEEEFLNVKQIIIKGNVKCCGFNASILSDIAIIGDDFDSDKILSYAKLLCKRGSELGINSIGIGSPKSRVLLSHHNLKEQWKKAQVFCEIFAKEAIKYNINIMWETLNKTESSFGIKLVESFEFVKNINLQNMKLILDIYHMYMQQESLFDLRNVMSLVNHVHIAERVGEQRRYPSENLRYYYISIIDILKQHGYDGIISTEAFDGDFYEGAKRTKELFTSILNK